MSLINDKSLLAKDLQAAIEYMNAHELVSGTLGLIGGSMGAIMALAGNGYEEVLSSDYPYSRLSVSAGFTLAVLITCELTVSTVVRMTIASGSRKNHQPILTRKAKFCSQPCII
jgi:hypothetical protein